MSADPILVFPLRSESSFRSIDEPRTRLGKSFGFGFFGVIIPSSVEYPSSSVCTLGDLGGVLDLDLGFEVGCVGVCDRDCVCGRGC
jgi:hypothetical protein